MEETIGRDMTQEELDCKERPAGEGLQDLFRESAREAGGTWTDSEVRAGSLAASDLVTQQQATSLQACARAIMVAPHDGLGWVFVTVETRNTKAHNVVWPCGKSRRSLKQHKSSLRSAQVLTQLIWVFRRKRCFPYLRSRCWCHPHCLFSTGFSRPWVAPKTQQRHFSRLPIKLWTFRAHIRCAEPFHGF
jgi:hypothetical protein